MFGQFWVQLLSAPRRGGGILQGQVRETGYSVGAKRRRRARRRRGEFSVESFSYGRRGELFVVVDEGKSVEEV